jgi:predicted RNase H-like nuclease (RuvC/YqgF family)
MKNNIYLNKTISDLDKKIRDIDHIISFYRSAHGATNESMNNLVRQKRELQNLKSRYSLNKEINDI